jgi:hypothetical protein
LIYLNSSVHEFVTWATSLQINPQVTRYFSDRGFIFPLTKTTTIHKRYSTVNMATQRLNSVVLKDWKDLNDNEKKDAFLLASITLNHDFWFFRTKMGDIYNIAPDLFFTHPGWAALQQSSAVDPTDIGEVIPSKETAALAWRLKETFLIGRVLFKEREPNHAEMHHLQVSDLPGSNSSQY